MKKGVEHSDSAMLQPDLFDNPANPAAEDASPLPLNDSTPDSPLFAQASGDEKGYDNWREKERQKNKAISETWNVPVCENARIKLTTSPKELEGFVEPVEWPADPLKRIPKSLKMRISLDKKSFALGERKEVEFMSNEVEKCKRLDPPNGT